MLHLQRRRFPHALAGEQKGGRQADSETAEKTLVRERTLLGVGVLQVRAAGVTVMIDDVTITTLLPEGLDLVLRSLIGGESIIYRDRKDRSTGREYRWSVVRGRGFVLRLCDETRQVELRLSAPRLGYDSDAPHAYNFPLRRYGGVERWPLHPVLTGLIHALGLTVAGQMPSETMVFAGIPPLADWTVKAVSFAVDVAVSDVNGTVMALAACRRKSPTDPAMWGSPTHAVQWQGDHRRVMFYSKAQEIRNRVPSTRAGKEQFQRLSAAFRAELAAEAEPVVRVEVSFRAVRRLRALWGLPAGVLPTLRTVAADGIDAFVLAEALRELRLDIIRDVGVKEVESLSIRGLAHLIGRSTRGLRTRSKKGGVSGTKRMAMGFLYLAHGSLSDAEIAETFGMSIQTVRSLHAGLRQAGTPPLNDTTPYRHHLLAAFMARYRLEMGELPEAMPTLVERDGYPLFGPAPWAVHRDADEAEREEDDLDDYEDEDESCSAA